MFWFLWRSDLNRTLHWRAIWKICGQTGHKSLEMLRVYRRDAELFVGNAAAGLL
jgi:hypothetical protein